MASTISFCKLPLCMPEAARSGQSHTTLMQPSPWSGNGCRQEELILHSLIRAGLHPLLDFHLQISSVVDSQPDLAGQISSAGQQQIVLHLRPSTAVLPAPRSAATPSSSHP